jgi:hypothetical protein
MIGLYKRNTAKVFPNAIEVVTLQHKYFFCSFMFRDAAFRLASTAWNDYLEASPSNETHRINVNSKFDLELYVKKSTGDEQVRMVESDEDGSESLGTSPPGEGGGGGVGENGERRISSGKTGKLGDSNKSNPTSSATSATTTAAVPPPPPGSGSVSNHFGAAGVVDSSEEFGDAGDGSSHRKDAKNKRKSSSRKRETVSNSATTTGAGAPSNRSSMDFLDESEETNGGPRRTETTSPTHSRHSVVVVSAPAPQKPFPSSSGPGGTDSPTLKAKAVGFDLRAPPSDSPATIPLVSESESRESPHDVNGNPNGGPNSSPTSERKNDASSSSSSFLPEPAPLPDISVTIPTTLSCKHILEEAEDKKFTGTKLGTRTFKNINLHQFFALVWCNPEYNQLLIEANDYTEWNAPPWNLSDTGCCAQRLLTYRMPLNASLGPKSTRVDSYQNARFKGPNCLLLETSNLSKDVPMGDAFEVHEKWVVTQEGNTVTVEITAGVIWKKTAWGLKGTINSKSMEGVTENFEHVSKAMETTITKYTSANAAYIQAASNNANISSVSTSSNNVDSSNSSKLNLRKKKSSHAAYDDDSSSSDEERKSASKRKRRAGRKGSKDGGSELRDSGSGNGDVASSSMGGRPNHQSQQQDNVTSGGFFGLSSDWKMFLFILLTILAFAALSSMFFNMATLSTRLSQMEVMRTNQQHLFSASGQEEMNLRERVAFLEHLTSALLHNITDPGSYKSEQQRYWTAVRDIDKFLLKTRDNVHTLQTTVHNIYEQRNEPLLTTSQVVDALRTLPIDRKVLNYLMNPEGFAQQLASVLASNSETLLNDISSQTNAIGGGGGGGGSGAASSWWPVYFGVAICGIIIGLVAVGKSLGLKLT